MGQDVERIPADWINDREAVNLVLDQRVHSFKYAGGERKKSSSSAY